ncbi:hypothetical protein [Pyxidicoccus sp. MSG2]|uniref:hypothetical protein n=1 Tax=Pyxidicoccus sp. MSG2 TaxID=2996790 RepID=UPI002271B922|nr:hypothetical protein [Pyxidicoccus sp. MSG2]MCY1019230.1 hypothetical protein [Pyxidicoccus sp. MSG2]
MKRAPGHSSRRTGAAGGARGPWLVAMVGVFLTLGLALGSAALAEPGPRLAGVSRLAGDAAGGPGAHGLRRVTEGPVRRPACLRFHGVGFDTWAALEGSPSLFPAHPSWGAARGRGGFPPAVFAVPRWSRVRQVPSDTAIARRVRYPVAPVSARSGLADQPPLVTRPLRGPPARG